MEKESVERGDIVAGERALIGGELGLDLGVRFGIVDNHWAALTSPRRSAT